MAAHVHVEMGLVDEDGATQAAAVQPGGVALHVLVEAVLLRIRLAANGAHM